MRNSSDYHAGIRNGWNNELTYSLFRDDYHDEYISSKNYFEWDTLERIYRNI